MYCEESIIFKIRSFKSLKEFKMGLNYKFFKGICKNLLYFFNNCLV